MFSRSMSSVVMTETVAGTSSSGRRVRVAAVVTASSCVGTGWPGGVMGVGGVRGHRAAGGGGGGVRVAAVVTASSCVGTGWPGVMMGVVVVPGHCAADGGGVVLPVASGVALG